MSLNIVLITHVRLRVTSSPNLIIEESDACISHIHIPFILKAVNGCPEDMVTVGHLTT